MKLRIKMMIAVLALAGSVLSCNLPQPSQTTLEAIQVGSTPSTDNGASQSTEIDFSQVRLTQGDLPQGFESVSEEEMNKMGFDMESFLKTMTTPLAKAEPQNLTAFINEDGVNSVIVVSFIVQPLTNLERGAFDLLARSPESAINLFKNAANGFTFAAQTDLQIVGDAAIGATFAYEKASLPLDGNLIISRRDQVIQVALVANIRGGSAGISGTDVARVMDDRIRAALE